MWGRGRRASCIMEGNEGGRRPRRRRRPTRRGHGATGDGRALALPPPLLEQHEGHGEKGARPSRDSGAAGRERGGDDGHNQTAPRGADDGAESDGSTSDAASVGSSEGDGTGDDSQAQEASGSNVSESAAHATAHGRDQSRAPPRTQHAHAHARRARSRVCSAARLHPHTTPTDTLASDGDVTVRARASPVTAGREWQSGHELRQEREADESTGGCTTPRSLAPPRRLLGPR